MNKSNYDVVCRHINTRLTNTSILKAPWLIKTKPHKAISIKRKTIIDGLITRNVCIKRIKTQKTSRQNGIKRKNVLLSGIYQYERSIINCFLLDVLTQIQQYLRE